MEDFLDLFEAMKAMDDGTLLSFDFCAFEETVGNRNVHRVRRSDHDHLLSPEAPKYQISDFSYSRAGDSGESCESETAECSEEDWWSAVDDE